MTVLKVLAIIVGAIFAMYVLSAIQMRAWLDTIELFFKTKYKDYEQTKKTE